MAEHILDGTGRGYHVKVDKNNQFHTFSVTESEQQQATAIGNSYNINTGNIPISGSTAILYFRNDENSNFILDAIAVGMGVANGGTDDIGEITLIRNPTEGTLIASASAADMNQNRNFGSLKVLKSTTLAYKGSNGSTITDGNSIAQFYQSTGGRLYATIDFELEKGGSIALVVDPKLTSGGIKCYGALIGYLKDLDNT